MGEEGGDCPGAMSVEVLLGIKYRVVYNNCTITGITPLGRSEKEGTNHQNHRHFMAAFEALIYHT